MLDVPARSWFLIEDAGTIRESWMHGGELGDIDAVIAAAQPGWGFPCPALTLVSQRRRCQA